jgi:hypothetical protein
MITSASEHGIRIVGEINKLREFVNDIQKVINGENIELPNYISDMFFTIESEYQAYHELDEHDYEYHPELK